MKNSVTNVLIFEMMSTDMDNNLNNHTSLASLLVLSFASIIYLYFPYIQNYSATPKWIVLALIGLIFSFTSDNKRTKSSGNLTIWYFFVLIVILQCFRSYNIWDSLTDSIPLLIAPLLMKVIKEQVNHIEDFYRIVATILVILISPILVYSALTIVGLMVNESYSHAATYNIKLSFGHRNQLAQFFALIVPLLVSGLFYLKNIWLKSSIWFILSLIGFVVIALQCKSAIIVMFILYPIGILIYLFFKLNFKWKVLVGIVVILLTLSITVFISQNGTKNIPVLSELTESNYGSGNERVRIWTNSLEIWSNYPIFGVGTGDWRIEILKTPLRFTQAENSLVYYQRAHNDFLQISVEQGLVGLLTILLFFAIVVVGLVKQKIKKPLKFALILGVLGFITIANFSFPFEKIELLFLLFIYLIPILIYSESINVSNYGILKFKNVIALVLILGYSICWIIEERKFFEYKKTGKIADLSLINTSVYSIDPTSTPLDWYIANSYYENNQLKEALTSYRKALAHNPYHVHVLNNIGTAYLVSGQSDSAQFYYSKALDINPIFTKALMNYAALHFNLGNVDGALGYILQVLLDDEPNNYDEFIVVIGKAKLQLLIEKHNDVTLKQFFEESYQNDTLIYEISKKCRQSGASYEDEFLSYYKEHFEK